MGSDVGNVVGKIYEFKCVPERSLYTSPEYKIYGVYVDPTAYPEIVRTKYKTASLVGNFQELTTGTEYSVKARAEESKYGIQYKVINVKRPKPSTYESAKAFLHEVITHNQAETLLNAYPDILDRIMSNDLEDIDLEKTKGIKEHTFDIIKRKVIENFKLAELVEEFQGIFNISTLKKLYDEFPSVEKIREVLRDEPYRCLCKLSGVGFKTADAMLVAIDKKSKSNIQEGKKPILFFAFDLETSYQRMKACADYIFDENENSGNTCMSIKDFKKECEVLAKAASHHLPVIIKDDDIHFDKDSLTIAKKSTYKTEEYIARKINEGVRESQNTSGKWENIEFESFRKLDGFDLTDEQLSVLKAVCENQIVILNGFGGAGKSSSTRAIINMLNHHKKTFNIFAPTGRASKIISEYTKQPAATIHRGLGFRPPNSWAYDEEYPLRSDIVIVDEASMIDIFLMKRLLQAINFKKTKLLLIGDSAQIPSVGAGNILHDLLHADNIPIVTLRKIFRYGEGGLMRVATDTRRSKEYLDKQEDGVQVFGDDNSYLFISVPQEKIVNNVVALYKKLLSQGYSTEDIGVLSCYNKGNYGTTVINNSIQKAINPREDGDDFITFGDVEFRLNDMVIQCKNDYDAIIYHEEASSDFYDEGETKFGEFIPNGEIGKICKVKFDGLVVDFDGAKIYYTRDKLKNLKLAYSISAHRSQGGAFKVVIFITPRAHTYMLTSNLLYVCETRAKVKCYHLGAIKTVNTALKKKENYDRKTMLLKILKERDSQ